MLWKTNIEFHELKWNEKKSQLSFLKKLICEHYDLIGFFWDFYGKLELVNVRNVH